jgi:uncharacterized membrane protein YidH (DUF202 family)
VTSAAGSDSAGVQAERTYLAWTRTGLAYLVVCALFLRRAGEGQLWFIALAAPAAGAAVGVLLRAHRRYVAMRTAIDAGDSPADARLILTVAGATALVCLTGLIGVFVS